MISYQSRRLATLSANSPLPTDATAETQQVLDNCSTLDTHQHQTVPVVPPTTTSDDGLITILARLKNGSVEDAANVFMDYCNNKKNFHSSISDDIGCLDPASELLTAVLNALCKSPQQSEAFIKAIQESTNFSDNNHDDNNNNSNNRDTNIGEHAVFRPNHSHYVMVLQGWHDFDPPSAKRAQALLQYMDKHGLSYCIDTCNLVLKTWARKENAEGAQALLDQILANKRFKVNQESFRHVLAAWSRSKSARATMQADTMLSLMETLRIEPCPECLYVVIECWAKSKKIGAETRIEFLVTWMKRLLKSRNTIKRLYVQEGNDDNLSDASVVQGAMLRVLQAYQKIGNAHRAEEILLEYVEEYRNNEVPPPTRDMCLSVLSCWSKSKSTRRGYRAEKLLLLMEGNDAFPKPDMSCYIATLHCLATSKKSDSAKRAEALLKRSELAQGVEPNLTAFTCVLVAWARSDNPLAHNDAERIYREIENRGMEPDRFVLAGLITAWGRSNVEDSIIKVEEYFQRMKNSVHEPATNGNNRLKPTVVEYTATIQAYANYVSRNLAKSRMSVERVETLLDEMLDSHDKSLRPTFMTYVAVLKTIAAARRIPDRGDRAERVLRIMSAEGVEVTPYILGLVNKCNVREPKGAEEGDQASVVQM